MSEENSRLDRLEAAIENQFELNAALRTSIEILNNAVESQRQMIESQRQETVELRATAEALLQVAQIHQSNIELLTTEFRHHRSDGHGA